MPSFPFTAVFGQQRLKDVLFLNAVNPAVSGVPVRGEEGTAGPTLTEVHRSILYVDEVSLLNDQTVDVLLGVAATRINTVVREGVRMTHLAHLLLIRAIDPEEGDLHQQLLDPLACAWAPVPGSANSLARPRNVTTGRRSKRRSKTSRRRIRRSPELCSRERCRTEAVWPRASTRSVASRSLRSSDTHTCKGDVVDETVPDPIWR